MGEPHRAAEDQHAPERYEIRLKGHLDDRWADWFAEMHITHASDGTTILTGPVADQAALHGLLRKVRDLGMPLISVLRADPTPASAPDCCTNTERNRSKKTNP
jgi:hypothetical protein